MTCINVHGDNVDKHLHDVTRFFSGWLQDWKSELTAERSFCIFGGM
jgi:hypothetical protein